MTAAKSVAILLDHFGPGGVERVACHVANGLAASGFAVEMVVLCDAGPVRSLLDQAVSVHQLGTARGLGRGSRLLAAVPRLARYLRTRRPTIFHSPGNHCHLAAAAAVTLARYEGVFLPKITNPILKAGMAPLKRMLRIQAYHFIFRRADRIIVLSRSGIGKIGEIHPAFARKALFLNNPYVSDEMMENFVSRKDCGVPLILSVGRLSSQKDYPTLLGALALLSSRPWRLRICGVGPDEHALRDLCAELGISERVEFAGFVEDVVPHYAEATAMVLSSRWEDLPATLIEAMACGCPVIATASSDAVCELLEEVGAHHPIPVGNVASLSAAIEKALNAQILPVARSAVHAFSVRRAVAAHASLCEGTTRHQLPNSQGGLPDLRIANS
ncbi:glycosyltransferase [Novosphingobium aquimarinum]|uniref:glycosyltransferase n=1 Tax=Novosphingobium aquimarinum TaxID=2682494 RepID=UPI0018DDA20D|nr:glycosyltransferase [Novosphingobium aquimarinum]